MNFSPALRAVFSGFLVLGLVSVVGCDDEKETPTSQNDGGATSDAAPAKTDGGTDSGGGGGAAGNSCGALCTGGGFSGGKEEKFQGTVTECTCEGTGTGIGQAACTTYCAQFSIPADKAFLSTENSPNDKCVCDGT